MYGSINVILALGWLGGRGQRIRSSRPAWLHEILPQKINPDQTRPYTTFLSTEVEVTPWGRMAPPTSVFGQSQITRKGPVSDPAGCSERQIDAGRICLQNGSDKIRFKAGSVTLGRPTM